MLVWMKAAGAVDRAVDVALGGEMHHGVGLELKKDFRHRRPVADIGPAKAVARVFLNGSKRGKIARVGQFVENKDVVFCMGDQVADQRRPDKARATGDNNFHGKAVAVIQDWGLLMRRVDGHDKETDFTSSLSRGS